jgi:hypothetical protein
MVEKKYEKNIDCRWPIEIVLLEVLVSILVLSFY